MILDERHHFGAETVAQVHDAWNTYVERINVMRARQRQSPVAIVDRTSELEAFAYVNASRWVLDCPSCGGGVYAWPDHPRAFCQEPTCLTIFRPLFPPKSVIAEAVPVLDERPDPATRNWEHHSRSSALDPKMLDVQRWYERLDAEGRGVGRPTGWESVTRLRNENLLAGGLSGDGTNQDVIVSPHLLLPNHGRGVTTRTRLDSGSVDLPPDAQTPPAPGGRDPMPSS